MLSIVIFRSTLHYASRFGRLEIVQTLLSLGASTLTRNKFDVYVKYNENEFSTVIYEFIQQLLFKVTHSLGSIWWISRNSKRITETQQSNDH